MINNYFKIAWRNLIKNKSSFFINTVGLTTGLTCVILIFLWVQDELSMDKFHKNDARLYQVMEVSKANDKIEVGIGTQGLLAEAMAKDLPEVEAATTFFSLVNEGVFFNLKTDNEKIIKAGGVFADDKFFEMFSYNLIEGQASKVLKNKESAVISKSLAIKLFGSETNPLGKSFEWEVIGKKFVVQVSGIFQDVPDNSTQQFDFVLTKASLFELVPNFKEWHNEGTNTFLLLKKGTDVAAFNQKIKEIVKKYSNDNRFTIFVRPYSSAYLYGNYENGVQTGGRIGYVKLFSLIGFFILIIACINFINLSTATASKREKEIGVKKAIGSTRKQLIFQFLMESVMIVTVSLLLAVCLVWLLTPQFNIIMGKSVSLHLNMVSIFYLAVVAIFTGVLSGYYPAIYMSNISAISVLKGQQKTSLSEIFARKGLVVFQFVISLFLIISVLTIYRQVEFIQTMNLGYDRNNVVYIEKEGSLIETSESFLNEARSLPGIVSASAINGAIAKTSDNATTSGIEWPGKRADQSVVFAVKTVDYDLTETIDIKMSEGRSFSRQFGAEDKSLVFNETAIRAMGIENPIGKTVSMWGEEKTIIGVTKDFFANSIHEKIPPVVMRYAPSQTSSFVMKIKHGREKETLSQLENLYEKFNPGYTFKYNFMDEKYQLLYASEQRVAKLSKYFAGLAILISCLGLFGLALFNAKIRTKEIGIRKVLGASVFRVVYILSEDFLKLAFIAVVIAFPLSWWALHQWFDQYAYKTDLSISIFIWAFIGIIVLTLLTVGYQAIKTATSNPVKSLRTE